MSRSPHDADEPGYLGLFRTGELDARVAAARELLSPCRVCPRACGARRGDGETGFCRTADQARLAHALPHLGEEPPLSGVRGAGAVFFAGCNMACCFCQNAQISQADAGRPVPPGELAEVFLGLQRQGCHNIDLVSPTHVAPQVLEAVSLAAARGLRLPLVYNSGGYDAVESLRLFDGVIDIYLPDAKYASDDVAGRLSNAEGYVGHNRAAVREMFRQVGLLVTDDGGVARRGLIVRHLVLPHGLGGTREVLRFVADELHPSVSVSLMAQYTPQHRAADEPEVNRPLTRPEYEDALAAFDASGLENAFVQALESQATGVPDFAEERPFKW